MGQKHDEDDWLDDVEAQARPRSKKPVLSRAKMLEPGEGNATVTEIFPNRAAARLDGRADSLLCEYRMSTLAFGTVNRERSPVCVGDRVRVEGANVIVGRCERRNRIIRPAPNARDPLLHVLAANLDLLVIVSSAREPEFSGGIVDRFLVAASAQRIPSALVVNKTDLLEPGAPREWAHYASAGVRVLELSARAGAGIEPLLELVRAKTAAFCGHSGVGKTSLLRKLLGDETYGRVSVVSDASGKGRHTTTGAVLLAGPSGASVIDTPGVMNFGLIDVKKADLLAHFPELQAAAAGCGPGCAHVEEAACALRALPRYSSYRSIRAAL